MLLLRALQIDCVFAAYHDSLKAYRTERYNLPIIVGAMYEFRQHTALHIGSFLDRQAQYGTVPKQIQLGRFLVDYDINISFPTTNCFL